MSIDLKGICTELSVLVEEMQYNFLNKKYEGYEHFIEEYNRILGISWSIDVGTDRRKIAFVEPGHKGAYGGISRSEMAKCNELVYEAKQLLGLIKLKVHPLDIAVDAIQTVELIVNKFHNVARQLRVRHGNRNTLDVSDEYDVQDLLHALLKIHFDDVRSEEWVPSYAGGSKRMDFLLKNEKIVIEVKKTRHGLADKEVGEQLLIDIGTYQAHPDCEKLICFVYDPEGRIGNPVGVENDLNKLSNEKLNIQTFICPK